MALLLAACGGSDSATAPPHAQADGAAGQDAIAPDAGTVLDASVEDVVSEPVPDVPAPLGPPYPIVLAHGFFGFEQFAGVDFATYFYGVKDYLSSMSTMA